MPTNFTACQAVWAHASRQDIEQYRWKGLVSRVPKNDTTQISLEGCLHFCGDDSNWYPWTQEANTMTTWVLPIIGILLQAPFVSNAFWETVFSLARWIGSPMASLAYILWNIKVTGKCAMIVDMAVPYRDGTTDPSSNFGKIRDSFYLLMTMNQYTMRSETRQKKEAEGLLRIVLFSKDLRLLKRGLKPLGTLRDGFFATPGWNRNSPFALEPPIGTVHSDEDLEDVGCLNQLRQEMAADMRAARRRGVVPVYISTMWFLFSLGLSIQAAFGFLGENAQAHDLALGLLLAWLPVLILSSIVDRNPVAAEDIRNKLNDLVERVRLSLIDDHVRAKFLESIEDHADHVAMQAWAEKISMECLELDKFFVKFAGQARSRYHYGAAHPILTDIEKAYIASEGRDWLRSEDEARRKLVLGDVNEGGLDWLDPRELWQVLSAVIIVGGSILGAFVLSFFTPTVGLGCRSGGYMIFGVTAFGLLVVEMISWWAFDASKEGLHKRYKSFRRRAEVQYPKSALLWARFAIWCASSLRSVIRYVGEPIAACGAIILRGVARILPPSLKIAMKGKLGRLFGVWQELGAPKRIDIIFFKPAECINSAWLIYIVMAQTVGYYNDCRCKSSNWAGGGGYVDFGNYDTSSDFIQLSWTTATVISATVMACGLLYIVTEWCLQSHLSTGDMRGSARGLSMTRTFRWLTSPYRESVHFAIEMVYLLFRRKARSSEALRPEPAQQHEPEAGIDQVPGTESGREPEPEPGQSRRSLKWTKNITCTRFNHAHNEHDSTSPELTTISTARGGRSRSDSQEPLVRGPTPDGSPFVPSNQDGQGVHTPRSSHDTAGASHGESPSSLRVPERRHAFGRQSSETMAPRLDWSPTTVTPLGLP